MHHAIGIDIGGGRAKIGLVSGSDAGNIATATQFFGGPVSDQWLTERIAPSVVSIAGLCRRPARNDVCQHPWTAAGLFTLPGPAA